MNNRYGSRLSTDERMINYLVGWSGSEIEQLAKDSIFDGIEALQFFSTQGVNTSRIKATLFYQLFFPFFAPFLVVFLYTKAPVMGRYFNTALIASFFAFITLATWSGLFVLSRLCANGVIFS